MFESGHHGRLFQLTIIRLFQLRRRYVPDRLEQPPVVEPIDPLQGCVLDGVNVPPGTTASDDFGLVQSVDRLGQGIVVRVTNTADRCVNARFGQTLRVADR